MTRRSELLALSAAMVSPGLMAQQARPVIRTRRLNNVMIAVSNLERSTAFYERLFGPPVRQGDAIVFRVGEGPHFFALTARSEEHTSELQSHLNLVCRLLLEKKKKINVYCRLWIVSSMVTYSVGQLY